VAFHVLFPYATGVMEPAVAATQSVPLKAALSKNPYCLARSTAPATALSGTVRL
jgi:hypothetical protein